MYRSTISAFALLLVTTAFAASARAEMTAMTAIKAYMVLEKLRDLPGASGDARCVQDMLAGNKCSSAKRCNDTQRLLRNIADGSEVAKSSLAHNVRNSSLYKDCAAALSKKPAGDWQAWALAVGDYEAALTKVANKEILREFLACAGKNGDEETATVEKSSEYMQAKCK